jgi:hypothetical protein
MAKIGRNEQCHCGSGKKFKRCCLAKQQAGLPLRSSEQTLKLSLMHEIELAQQAAAEKRPSFREMGVFLFFSTATGDAWLLEMTESDGVQVAREGVALPPPIDQNPETIEVEWSHTFAIHNREMTITSYADHSTQALTGCPTAEISAAMKRIRKKYSAAQLSQVHVHQEA